MTHIIDQAPDGLFRARIPAKRQFPMSRGRAVRYAAGTVLLAISIASIYQNVIVQTSQHAVINARIVPMRAPMDGIVTMSTTAPGASVQAGATLGQIEDPHPDDGRAFALQQDLAAAQRERDLMSRRLADLERARAQADTQAEAYRVGRVRQDELRAEEAQAQLNAALAREAEAAATASRSEALHLRGVESGVGFERALRTRETTSQERIAAQKRLQALHVDLQAARAGTYLGDNYNDVPSSYQRARTGCPC